MKPLMVFVAVLLLALGCAPIAPKATTGPSGKPAYTMKCSGFGRTLEDCFVEAGSLCPGGYAVVNQSSGIKAVPISGQFMVARDDSLTIECN